MYINKLAIINFKSCKKVLLNFYKDQPNTFIGANDCGKSAILNSVGLLFDHKKNINIQNEGKFSSDISNTPIGETEYAETFSRLNLPILPNHNVNALIIGELVFERGDLEVDFIDSLSTQLKWSIENWNEKKIYILRSFDNETPGGKFYLCCLDKDDSPLQLWYQSQSYLKEKINELNISDKEIENDNNQGRFTNLEKIRAIYKKINAEMVWSEYHDFRKDNDKGFFPIYLYIDWNTSLKQLEELASAAMASKIAGHKQLLKMNADQVSDTVTNEVNADLKVMLEEMNTDLPNISSIKAKVNFSITESVTDLVISKNTSDGDIRMESQGEGIKKQIMFAFLKWTSLKEIPDGEKRKRYIWCFDEPEVHLYPSAQRELFGIIKKLTSSIYQVFISTHSTIFVNKLSMNQIKQVTLNSGYSEISECTSIEDIHSALGVKNSDFLFFDKFLLYEGNTEEVLIPYFYQIINSRTLEEDNIQTINLGGKDKAKSNKKIFENLLRDFKKTKSYTRYILDADSSIHEDNVYLVGKYDIEDSISDEVWISLVKNYTKVEITKEEIKTIRDNLGASSERKFYNKLKELISTKPEQSKYLPSKGEDSAELIKKYITKIQDIPIDIVKALENLI